MLTYIMATVIGLLLGTLIILALTIKVIGQGIRLNGYVDEENSREIEAWQRQDEFIAKQAEFILKQMPEGFDVNAEVFKNGYIGELEVESYGDTESTTDINHNLRNNR